MLRKDFILFKTRNLLNEFMGPITAKAGKPRQKFLPQAATLVIEVETVDAIVDAQALI